MMSTEFKQIVRERILDSDQFIEATFKGQQRGHTVPWQRVTLRPVLVKGTRHLQISWFDGQQDTTRNFLEDAAAEVGRLLTLPFNSIVVKTREGTVLVQFTKKGKALVHQHRQTSASADLSHDRRKDHPLPDDRPDPFLQAVGIMSAEGKIRPRYAGKYKQINEFIRLLAATGELDALGDESIHVVDLGCGSAYLTFALYHYLTATRGLTVSLTGVDLKADLMARHAAKLRDLGWPAMQFVESRIIDYVPETPPDIVVALHACDTATDEAIAQGIRHQSRMIFCAPCCHHHVQAQLAQQAVPDPFRPIMRHGILREEMGTLLTDALRALILRIMGYRTDVIEFVSAEHTPKNNLIRAVRRTAPGDSQFVQEYEALKQFWGVTPYLETLLGDRFWEA